MGAPVVERVVHLLAVVVAAAVVWLATGGLAWPARALTVVLVVLLPPLAVAQVGLVESEDVAAHRNAVYLSSAGVHWLLAGVAVWAGLASGFGVDGLGLIALPPLPVLAWSVGTILVLVAVVLVGRALGLRESPLLACLLPRTGKEKLGFAALAVSAGVCEEVVFRGFLLAALTVATGSAWVAAPLAAGAFGILHAYQRATGVARAAVLGLLLTVPFLATGSLIPSIIAHVGLDLLAGLWLGRRLV